MENAIFEASYLYYMCNSKAIEICPNQDADLLRFFFTDDYLKIKKGLERVSKPHFSHNFLIKILFCNITQTDQILLSDCVYFPSYSVKWVSFFMLGHFMTSWHLNTWKVKMWLSQERKELSRLNKKHSSLF